MFSTAYSVARNFTRPVAMSARLANGTVRCGLATFIIVNKAGWILTAGHVLNDLALLQLHTIEKQAYDAKRAAIAADVTLSHKERKTQNTRLIYNPEWITNQSFWWCDDRAVMRELYLDKQADTRSGYYGRGGITRVSQIELLALTQCFPE